MKKMQDLEKVNKFFEKGFLEVKKNKKYTRL